jgi:hypothetical protein
MKLGARRGRLLANTSGGGTRPRNQGSRSYPSTSPKEEREDALARWSPEEDWWSRRGNAPPYPGWPTPKAPTQGASSRKFIQWWWIVRWLPSWKFCFWWRFSLGSRTACYTVAPIIQATSASYVWWAFRPEAVPDELRSNHIFIWGQYCSHGEILRHGSQKRSANLVLFTSARDNYVLAEAKRHARH